MDKCNKGACPPWWGCSQHGCYNAALRNSVDAMITRDRNAHHSGGNYGADIGVDGSYGQRERQHNDQMESNHAYSDNQKGGK